MIRLEGKPRGHGIEEGLAARMHDPLWMLARQWQFGEFRHENAASPASVDVAVDIHLLDQWHSGPATEWAPYDPSAEPLERLVEDAGTPGPAPRLRLEGGLRLRRLLAGAGAVGDLPVFAARCPFPDDPGMDPIDRAVRRRIPDGAQLVPCLEQIADPAGSGAEIGALRAVAAGQLRCPSFPGRERYGPWNVGQWSACQVLRLVKYARSAASASVWACRSL